MDCSAIPDEFPDFTAHIRSSPTVFEMSMRLESGGLLVKSIGKNVVDVYWLETPSYIMGGRRSPTFVFPDLDTIP